jgi:cephalosporin hydroxylase
VQRSNGYSLVQTPLSVVRRDYVAARNMLRADPAFWQPGVWASLKVAREAQHLGAMQKLRELAPLIALVRRRSPRVVVEIGTARGGTLYAWCRAAAPDATVVSIDLPGGPFGGADTPADVRMLRRYGRPEQELHFVRDDSHDAGTRARLEAILRGREVDFLMIDGDHTYDGVKQDFEMYSPLVGEGNPIAFHDVLPHPAVPSCEVDRFWKEVKANCRHVEFIDRAPGTGQAQYGGIGVLYAEARAAARRGLREDQTSIASR